MSNATKESIEAFAKEHEITLESKFVPWSQSRSFVAGTRDPLKRNLNWRITLKHKGREVLTCDYSDGIARAPCYNSTRRLPGGGVSLYDEELFIGETETGFAHNTINRNPDRKRPIVPEFASVLHSLALDAEVLNHRNFESWAGDYGYDSDSRAAEKIYQLCLGQALALRNGLGESLLAKLQDVVSGY